MWHEYVGILFIAIRVFMRCVHLCRYAKTERHSHTEYNLLFE